MKTEMFRWGCWLSSATMVGSHTGVISHGNGEEFLWARQWNFQTLCRGEQLQGLVSTLAMESLGWTQLIQEGVWMSNTWDCRWLININYEKLINLMNIKRVIEDLCNASSGSASLSEAGQCSGSDRHQDVDTCEAELSSWLFARQKRM